MNLFPQSTEVGKKIPKQKFYDNLNISPALKRSFIDDVNAVIWENKLAESTMNVLLGEKVLEIEVFRIILNNKDFDENILRQMDKEIPYHILYVLEYQNEYCLCVSNKETSSGNNAFKILNYYYSKWTDNIEVFLDGINLDNMYDNLIIQIGDIHLEKNNNLKEQIEINEKRKKLEKEIAKLEKQARAEKQPKKKFELVQEIKKYNAELEVIVNEQKSG